MNNARLLAEATPLPWDETAVAGRWISHISYDEEEADVALIVAAVNNLPAYEEAVEALEALCDFIEPILLDEESLHDLVEPGRAALARLRGDA